MQSIRRSLLSSAMLLALAACGDDGGSGTTAAAPTPAPSASPTPTAYNSELDTTVSGRDQNVNGVRDDVDTYISATYSGDLAKYAAGYARQLQRAILISSPSDYVNVANDIGRNVDCLAVNAPEPEKVVNVIHARTINTESRLAAYTNFDKSISGSSFALPSDSARDAFCASVRSAQ